MKPALRWCLWLLLAGAIFPAAGRAEPLPFRRAMELALKRGAVSVAAAEQQRAYAGYQEARNLFLPQLVVGSGLAKTWGFPLSIEGAAPSAFSVNYQSFLVNFAQRQFVKSAKLDWMAASANSTDQRNATLLEAALTYIQLDNTASRFRLLQQQQTEAQRLVQIVTDRVRAGVDADIELTRARLQAAHVRLSLAQAAANMDVLRERLAQLTGMPAGSIETVTESIPDIPDVSAQQNLVSAAVAANPAVKAAEDTAAARAAQAKGEHRALLPAFDAVAQYGYFTRYNNYDEYFRKFQTNNATVGVAIRFPFLNFAQRARAEGADADAVKASRQVQATKDQVSTETMKLARSIEQWAAAAEVARLEYELSQAQAQAIETRIQAQAPGAPAAPGQPAAPAPGPRELQAARLDATDKYGTYLDTTFELQKAKLQLLRAAGKLESWAAPSQP
jgi:outer membrane protein